MKESDSFEKAPRKCGAFSFYLRSPEPGPVGVNVDPLGEPLGARVFPEAFPALGVGPEGLELLKVGTWFVEPTDGATDEPTDGATDDPLPESPACASANVLERAKAVASTIVLSFMRLSFLSFRQATTAPSV
jgi:hypothetical protein